MKKIFSKGIIYPFFTLLGIVGIFDWIVFPALTAADTLGNILGVVIGFFTLVFGYFALGVDKIIDRMEESDEVVPEKVKDELQIKAGIKGKYQKSNITPEGAKIIADRWRGVETEDVFVDIPFSRLSKETKEKMVAIAKEDLKNKLKNEKIR
jgi:hypothetical protein